MKVWWTAQELALQALPGLPATKRGVALVAEQLGWATRTNAAGGKLARPRKARGGGVEFHYTVLPVQAVGALVSRGFVFTRDEAAMPVAPRSEIWAAFEGLPDAKKAIARFRFDVLKEVEALKLAGHSASGAVTHVVTIHRAKAKAGAGDEHTFGQATVYNWQRMVRGLPKGDWLPALAPRTQGRTATSDCSPEAWEFLKADYLSLSKPSFESCFDRLADTAEHRGWTIPSAKTLKRKLEREIPEPVMVLARDGYEKLERMYPPMQRDRSEFHALQAVNADGHKADVFVQFPDRPKPSRPMILGIQDLYSGKILAYRVGETEGSDLVSLAIGDMASKYGVPELVWLDNGRGFASKWITGGTPNRYRFKVKDSDPVGVLTALGSEVRWTRPYSGRSKPIERAWRDLCDRLSRHPAFRGAYTGNNVNAKPEDYGSRAVPLDVFETVLADVVRRHNAKTGRESRVCRGVLSFDQAFEASYANALIRKATDSQLRMCLLAPEAVTADRLTGSVTISGNRYWSEFLTAHRGEKLVLRFDPNRLHEEPVHVYTTAGAYLGPAEIQELAGFADKAAARRHSNARGQFLKRQKELLEIERTLTAQEVVDLLPEMDGEDFAPTPSPRAVRLIPGLQTAPSTAAALAEPSFLDRFAEAQARQQPAEHLRLVE